MGPDETATATTGGPRVIDVFDGNGAPSGQIIYFFRMQIGPRARSGIGLGSGSRLRRMRPYLVLSESSGSRSWGTWALARRLAERVA